MAGEVTLNQLLQAPTIRSVVSQLKSPISAFQQHYKMTPGSTATDRVTGTEIGWDIFNSTRKIAKVKPRNSGPARTTERPVGHNSATLVRMHDSIHLEQDKIFNTRDLGVGWNAPLDVMGQKYIERQLKQLTRLFANGREFMLSRMFRGGFGVKFVGDDMKLVESNDANAAFTVDYGIPTGNLNQVTFGTSDATFTESFDDPSADIPGMLWNFRKRVMMLLGFEMTEYWINSTTFTKMQVNNYMAQVAGTANTVFESITGQGLSKEEANAADGYVVRFRALPKHKFIVYDGTLIVGDNVDTVTDMTQVSLTVPDNIMIATPAPDDSDWLGCAEGSEIVAESYVDPGKHVHGFHTWKNRTILPPGWDLIGVDNWVPILRNPYATFYATVIY